jgi:hypothetical protein
MKKVMIKAGVAAAMALGLVVSGAATANATSLYNNNNYNGFLWSGTSTGSLGLPVGANDLTSSFTNVGVETYCENANCSGRRLSWSGNANALGAIQTGLNPFETWSDRISGVL